ncbi:MAG: hypothetical protein ACP5RN_15135 [Armatimonadota bacterium]
MLDLLGRGGELLCHMVLLYNKSIWGKDGATMGMVLHIDSPDFIDAVNDIIHDCWFAVDDISFDALASRLSIPFEYELPGTVAKNLFHQDYAGGRRRKGLLCFHGVLSYMLDDTERIGRYDFNRIQYDPVQGMVRIVTNIPLLLAIQVQTFEVTVEIS